jgi:flagellar basal-body rod protein FlgB
MRPAKSAELPADGAAARERPMPISNIPIFSMLRTKMQWHQERQRLLSENVANADTPRFQARDLTPVKFNTPAAGVSQVALARTDPAHMAGANAATQFTPDRNGRYEIRPTGNAVNLEDEMLKVAGNQMDYQAATALYGRSLGLIKSALGKR